MFGYKKLRLTVWLLAFLALAFSGCYSAPVPSNSFTSTIIDNHPADSILFRGYKWYSSLSEFIENEGTPYREIFVPDGNIEVRVLYYQNIEVAGYKAEMYVRFHDDMLYEGEYIIEPFLISSADYVYSDIKQKLTRNYGAPDSTESYAQMTFEYGDGRRVTRTLNTEPTDGNLFAFWGLYMPNVKLLLYESSKKIDIVYTSWRMGVARRAVIQERNNNVEGL